MKTRFILFAAVMMTLASCGTSVMMSQDNGQKFQDGIYYRPQSSTLAIQTAQQAATDELISKTKDSRIFVKTMGKVDTLVIPDNMSAKLTFDHNQNATTVDIYDSRDLLWYNNPFYDGYWSTYSILYHRYSPASFAWRSYRPYWYSPYSVWGTPLSYWGYYPYYAIGCSPWYAGWYDPWFYDPFYYDPWFYGYYDPWFYDPWFYGGGFGTVHSHHRGDVATRGDAGIVAASTSRAGIGRIPNGGSAAALSRGVSSVPSRVAGTGRTAGSVSRSAGSATHASGSETSSATSVRRASATGATAASRSVSSSMRSNASSSRASSVSYSGANASRGASASSSQTSGSVRRPSATSYGRSTAESGSQSYNRSSSSSSYSNTQSRTMSTGSSSSVSRSSGGYSGGGGSYSGGGASRSAGSSSGGGASHSSGGRR